MEILSCYACIPLIKIICTPDMTYGSTERIILSFWPIFCPFTPLTAQKMKILKMKKNPGDVIILHKCTKSHDHPLYCSGDVAWDGCNCYFSFWAIFCPFNHLRNWKKKLSKKKTEKTRTTTATTMTTTKTTWRYHFTQVYQKSRSYAILVLRYMVHDRCNYFLFWAILCSFTPLTSQKIKMKKK